MFNLLKKFLIAITFNSSLFIVLIIGIQNSSIKKKVNILIGETVSIPISFIVGVSFISGSLMGSLLTLSINEQRD